MKTLRLFAAVAALFLCAQVALAQGLDSLAKRQLTSRLDEYLAAIETSGVDVQNFVLRRTSSAARLSLRQTSISYSSAV